ncbi:hypothetical protein Tco_0667452 [Tanacetum coccineum]
MNIDQDRQILMVDDNAGNRFRLNVMQNVENQVVLNASQNPSVQNVGNQNGLTVVSEIANPYGNGNVVTRNDEPGKQDAAYLQKQMQITQKEEAGIQLTQEEIYFMADAGAYDEIEKVTANCNLQDNLQQASTSDVHNWSSSVHQEIHKIVKDEIFSIVDQIDARVQNFEIQFLKEAAKFVQDFKSLAEEADESLAKHKALDLESERLLKAVVSQDIMYIMLNPPVVETSDLQTKLERMKERFENYIIKKENEYAKL